MRHHALFPLSRRAAALILSVLLLACTLSAAPAAAEEDPIAVPAAAVDPALVGVWRFSNDTPGLEVELIWTFNADGTGSYAFNGYTMPIASYVATAEPFTEYPEDGCLLTVYFGVYTETIGDTEISIQMDPVEYGYIIEGDTLRILFTRDIANDYTDYTRQ